MDDCLRMLSEGTDTELDTLLAAQVNCHIVANHLRLSVDGLANGTGPNVPSEVLAAALLQQIANIRQRLPASVEFESKNTRTLYLISEFDDS